MAALPCAQVQASGDWFGKKFAGVSIQLALVRRVDEDGFSREDGGGIQASNRNDKARR